jgi:(1->4)-alpha-D-glucan 1-alpha-D-glucosylmutase
MPVAPQTLGTILHRAADAARNDTLRFLAESYERLLTPGADDRPNVLVRHRDVAVLDQLLQRICDENADMLVAIDHSLEKLNADFDALDDFLNQQNFRLAFWKVADQQLGYRRFFDVNTLIGLRMERDYVFEETHELVIEWLHQGVIDGIRVDHPDGLRDPQQYFERLRERAPDAWIVGEKILARGEFLRESWPIQGTSGYDFLNTVQNVLVSTDGLRKLGAAYVAFTGDDTPFPTTAHDKKIAVEQEALGSDVNRLTNLFVDICEANRQHRDHTRAEVRRALRETAACLAVYRTYVIPQRDEISDEDRTLITRATRCARDNRADIDPTLFDFIREVLTLETRGPVESEFVLRFQQFTSPVMAKGVEDTAFYCSNRLTALNEVGADPACDGLSVESFHAYQQHMQGTHPATMVGLSTHDTKRSDDVRARLLTLTEMPDAFAAAAKRWSEANGQYRSGRFPDPGTEWFLFQTLVGAWPIDTERLTQYMMKAMHEAKLETSWTSPNEEYEKALKGYIEAILKDNTFCTDLAAFVASTQTAGRVNSLAQTLMKHTVPGVPDLYQGSELWDFSLVDPDNRRPVDYALRAKLLAELPQLNAEDVLRRADEGLPKLWVIHHALRLRREHPEWFGADAAYTPLAVRGAKCEHALAYMRCSNVITVAPRLSLLRGEGWGDTAITVPGARWRNVLTGTVHEGSALALEDVLRQFPVALLVREEIEKKHRGK